MENKALDYYKSGFNCAQSILKACNEDLKLENIMVESLIKKRATLVLSDDRSAHDFDIKIIDFGASSTFKTKQKLTEKTGTPYYTSP